ncbi:MAG: Asp-tRNA(Asn)/Glu-tRNA(Gln) amidotransferase subunit GatB [Candidatus Omnitrophica bacterium]|nr:Asp-tRNA(Asn)/Glu-tRNA(Gln) amidotransferase subunit GatB [Candidatus Omnitrophota bacterium]
MDKYDIVIGLEVHVQLNTNSKIFCGCSTNFDSPPNTNICPVCCGYPGVLPVFNKRALELAVRICLALGARVNKKIYFERKNYFYPDLPKNYQISQYKMPLGEKGSLELSSGKKIGITRVHLEEDAGKLIHKENASLVDFNRTGTPLLEIVSEPDITSPEEAFDYLTYLKLTLQYIGASSCDMEKGFLRCDANISLKNKGATELGTKVELKNMNSFRGVRDALTYEAKRQRDALEKGEKISLETRAFDAAKMKTVLMRSKEEAHDYRYFPEPDLLDFSISQDILEQEAPYIKELPLARRKRIQKQYGISEKETDILISDIFLADFFEEACTMFAKPKEITNWLLGVFLEQVNLLSEKFNAVKMSPQNFSKVVRYFCENKLNNLAAKKVISLCIVTDEDIDAVIERESLAQVSAEAALSGFVQETINENKKAIKEYLEGKEQAIMFLVGMVMKKSKGKANPKVVREMLEKAIKLLKSNEAANS